MSEQAPFVDAATSIDPVNRENTFISYYSYGSILGLALDLKLRENELNLDDFMKAMWKKFGKNEVAYSVEDIEQTLAAYAGNAFAKAFFDQYIYKSNMPDYNALLASVGLTLSKNIDKASLAISVNAEEGGMRISQNTSQASAAYRAGLDKGDLITAIDGTPITSLDTMKAALWKIKMWAI